MSSVPTAGEPSPEERRAVRVLLRAGCTVEELATLRARLERNSASPEEATRGVCRLAEFTSSIGRRASSDYLRAIRDTGDVERLTDDRVLAFAESVEPHTSEWLFWAIWGTGKVDALTAPAFLGSVRFFRAMSGAALVEYFLAIRETREAERLTDPRVLTTAESIGSDAASEFFGAVWETGEVGALCREANLDYLQRLGPDAARELCIAIRETRDVESLLDPAVQHLAEFLGPKGAEEYFRAVRVCRAASRLTDPSVLIFAESVGRGPARRYFQVLGSTKSVAELTSPSLLAASGVIRSIGAEAALDYFLAAARAPPSGPGDVVGAGAPAPSPDREVPVLTLLDLPTYAGYRAGVLVGLTAAFWGSAFEFGGLRLGAGSSIFPILVSLATWGLVVGAGYVLSGMIARHSSEEFLRHRRQLLNEHGIRWHDCSPTYGECEVCWGSDRQHRDARFDQPQFCRCPSC